MAKNNGGPAFPRPIGEHHPEFSGDGFHYSTPQIGMSLREWYAGLAMQAMFNGFQPQSGTSPDVYRVCAREAFAVADAMIAEGAGS